jgi:hypothetical protein
MSAFLAALLFVSVAVAIVSSCWPTSGPVRGT